MVRSILESVIALDPDNKTLYEANSKKLTERFIGLDTQYSKALKYCKNEEVIVSHDAYGYLANRYGFEIHAIAGLSTQDIPSAKILAQLKEEAEE